MPTDYSLISCSLPFIYPWSVPLYLSSLSITAPSKEKYLHVFVFDTHTHTESPCQDYLSSYLIVHRSSFSNPPSSYPVLTYQIGEPGVSWTDSFDSFHSFRFAATSPALCSVCSRLVFSFPLIIHVLRRERPLDEAFIDRYTSYVMDGWLNGWMDLFIGSRLLVL